MDLFLNYNITTLQKYTNCGLETFDRKMQATLGKCICSQFSEVDYLLKFHDRSVGWEEWRLPIN